MAYMLNELYSKDQRVVFFPSDGPPLTEIIHAIANAVESNQETILAVYRPPIRFKSLFRNVIYDVMKSRGWKETESETDWNIFWCDKEWILDDYSTVHLQSHQRVNHFRNFFELTRKDALAKNMKKMRRHSEKAGVANAATLYNYLPTTFVLPTEYSLLVEEYKKQSQSRNRCVWIAKPVGRSQGKGIFLFDKLSALSDIRTHHSDRTDRGERAEKGDKGDRGERVEKGEKGERTDKAEEKKDSEDNAPMENYIVQKYISNPLLLGGKKFDMRLYVLVLSYNPLTVWIYRGGFARFSHSNYSLSENNLDDLAVHLTNVAIQKHQANYEKTMGGKWDVDRLKLYLMSVYGEARVDNLFNQIEDIIVNSLMSVKNVIIQDKTSFELYGYDVIIDAELTPFLLEVNASPSMTANTHQDYLMKCMVLDDVFTILDLEKVLVGTETQIGGFDLVIRRNELLNIDPITKLRRPSCIGNKIHREESYKKLCQQIMAHNTSGTSLQPLPSTSPLLVSTNDFYLV